MCAAALILAPLAAAAGQRTGTVVDPATSPEPQATAAGWSLTPSLLLSRTYDDNVLLHGPGDPQNSDLLNVISPRGDLNYTGRHGSLSMHYEGAFILYSSLSTLNSYDQHGGIVAKQQLSKRSSFFLNASVSAAPTTELLEFTGVPFVRVGSFTDDVRSGVEHLVSKRMTITAAGHFEQVRFEAEQASAPLLLGGHSIGGDVSLRYRFSEHTSFTADADAQHATIGTAEQVFDIQHAVAGLEQQLTPSLQVYASGGISRLGVTDYGPPRTGPSWKLGLVDHYRTTIIDLSFVRSFVPSFGFGGTTQNEAVTARIHLPITRRIYTQDLVSWSREDPLTIAIPQLRTTWFEAAVGYAARPWIRIEAYYAGTRQTAQVEGLLQHNQYGVQVIAGKPVRIR